MATTSTRAARRWPPIGQVLLNVFFVIWSVICIYPFVWMAFSSLKPFKELVSSYDLFPHTWTLINYQEIVRRVGFLAAFRNSVTVAVTTTAALVLTSSAMGFIFAKYRFKGREALFMALLATMMVPGAVTLIPLYIMVAGEMGLVDRLLGVIIVGLWSTFGIFMLRQFMESIPSELIDAARIDGASEWRIFFRLVIPLSTAPMSALATFAFLGSWDNLLWPMIILNAPTQRTLPMVLASMRALYMTRYDMWAAGSMLTVIPVMILYACFSRYFIRGIAMTGMKA